MVQFNPLPVKWKALWLVEDNGFANDHVRSAAIERRLLRILSSWKDTPYDAKFASKGIGVYCTAFVARVLDELYGQPPTELAKIPVDIGFHDKQGAFSGLKWFMRQYPTKQRLRSEWVQPGDVLITGPQGGGPGHAMIVGPRENTLWHATGTAGVHFTGFAMPESYQFFAAYRFMDRGRWFHGL